MKLALLVTCAIVTLAASTASQAALTVDTTISGVTLDFGPAPPDLADKIKGNSDLNGLNPLVLITDSGHLVDFNSTTAGLTQNGGNGFATVEGPGGGGFANLTITPEAPTSGFTGLNFNLMPVGNGNHTYYGDMTLYQLLGGTVTFSNVALDTNGNNKFAISSNDNRAFSSIVFNNLHLDESDTTSPVQFDSIRQVSINLAPAVPAVPEPATWAMMLVGFGAMGASLRRRRPTMLRQAT